MKKLFVALMTGVLVSGGAQAINLNNIRFSNEAADTTRINELLVDANRQNFKNSGECVVWFGNHFVDVPYVAGTLEIDSGKRELLSVALDQLDCTTFVETVLALTYTVGEKRNSWRDFVYNLERIRYRNGNIEGYPSRLHYVSDWIVDNTHRGIFTDATRLLPRQSFEVKSLNFMTTHRNLYPALSDSDNFARIKAVESGYRNHRFPYIKAQDIAKPDVRAALRNGDVVAFTTKVNGLDVSHLGIIVVKNKMPYLMHASSSARKVIVNDQPLEEYFRKNRNLTGLRIIRLKDW